MAQYVVRRLLVAVPMLIGAISIVFLAMRILPGDPCLAMLGDEATRQALADCRLQLGLDRPVYVQYVDYISHSLRFDFGRSLLFNYSVTSYLWRMFPHTLLLVVSSTLVAIILGIPSGVFSALQRRNLLIDYALRIVSLLGLSIPVFYFGILLLIVLSLHFNLFPLIGGGDLDTVLDMLKTGEVFQYPLDFWVAVRDVLWHLALPAFALGFTLAGTVARLSRSAMLEVISQDYIRTARSKGLQERIVVYKHALRNVFIPLLTIIGLFVGITLAGAVLTETVFARPGLGKMVVDGIGARDYPLVQGAITVITMTIILVNLIVDILYAVIDPRISYK